MIAIIPLNPQPPKRTTGFSRIDNRVYSDYIGGDEAWGTEVPEHAIGIQEFANCWCWILEIPPESLELWKDE